MLSKRNGENSGEKRHTVWIRKKTKVEGILMIIKNKKLDEAGLYVGASDK